MRTALLGVLGVLTVAVDATGAAAAFVVTGPAGLSVTEPLPTPEPLRVDPYHASVLVPDRLTGLRVELLEMPGRTPDRDLRAELNPRPRDRVTIPVTLWMDDADPRTDALWQAEVRKRFEPAAPERSRRGPQADRRLSH